MAHGVTLKAVRDELAALGHNLSEGVVASLLADAGASGLLQEALDEVDEIDGQRDADHTGFSDEYQSEIECNICEESLQGFPDRRASSTCRSESCDGEPHHAGPLPGRMDDHDGNVCSHAKWTIEGLEELHISNEISTIPLLAVVAT